MPKLQKPADYQKAKNLILICFAMYLNTIVSIIVTYVMNRNVNFQSIVCI